MAALLLLIVKASALLALVLCLVRALRRGSAGTRHTIWSVAFAALLALPALALLMPALDIPVPASLVAQPSAPVAVALPAAVAADNAVEDRRPDRGSIGLAPSGSDEPSSPRGSGSPVVSLTPPQLLWWAWGTGTVAAIAALLLSLMRVRQLARTADDLTDREWRAAADAAARRAGLRAPVRLVVSEQVRTPMAGGLLRPTVFLPAAAPSWDEERRNVVLAHELAHLARRDPLRHVAARLAVACYWFHPLAWLAAREASIAREEACDEAVLALGTRPSSYAQVLLDFADLAQPPARSLAALPIVERSLLEKRVMAILADHAHRPPSPRPFLPAALIALLVLGLAAARPAARAPLAPITPPTAIPPPTAISPPTAIATLPNVVAPPLTKSSGQSAATLLDSACDGGSGPFSGSMSRSENVARTIVYEQIGTRGADRVIRKTLGEVEVCMVAYDTAGSDAGLRPSDWPGRAPRTVIEARMPGAVQRLETTRAANGAQRVVWKIGGAERAFDPAAQEWRERMLAVLDATWEISRIRGEVSSRRGEISSLRGQESSLRGEISSLRGEVSSMRGQISSVHGEESSLRGQISTIQGEVSSLRGQISSEQGAISTLQAQRMHADDAERVRIAAQIKRHEAEIARLEQQIREFGAEEKIAAVERDISALNATKKAAAIESEIRKFDIEAKVAALERRIAELDVAGNTAAIEKEIARLEIEGRGRELEKQLAAAVKQLTETIARVR